MEGIAQTLDPVTPPPALKQRVIASLAAQPQEPPRRPVESNVVALPPKGVKIRRGVHPGWLAAAASRDPRVGAALYSSIATRGRWSTMCSRRRRRRRRPSRRPRVSATTRSGRQTGRPCGLDPHGERHAADCDGRKRKRHGLDRARLLEPHPRPSHRRRQSSGATTRAAFIKCGSSADGRQSAPDFSASRAAGRGMLIVPPPSGVAPGPVTVAVTDEPPGGLAAPSR